MPRRARSLCLTLPTAAVVAAAALALGACGGDGTSSDSPAVTENEPMSSSSFPGQDPDVSAGDGRSGTTVSGATQSTPSGDANGTTSTGVTITTPSTTPTSAAGGSGTSSP